MELPNRLKAIRLEKLATPEPTGAFAFRLDWNCYTSSDDRDRNVGHDFGNHFIRSNFSQAAFRMKD